jgi:Undecaprenyl-phosphate glucose phosphotransferase
MSLQVLPRTRAEQIGAFSTQRAEKFGIYYARMALMDFVTVAVTAYLTGFMYHALVLQPLEDPELSLYFTTALFLSSTSLMISLASRQFATVQLQQQYKFLLSGVGSVALAFSLLLSAMFLLKLSGEYSRAALSLQFVAVTIAVVAERAISHSRLRFLVKSGRIESKRVVLIGDSAKCGDIISRLQSIGISTVGVFPFPGGVDLEQLDDPEVRSIINSCRALAPEEIFILGTSESWSKMAGVVELLSELPAGLHVLPTGGEGMLAPSGILDLGCVVAIQVASPPLSALDLALKRAFDLAASIAGLLLLSPLFLMVAAMIKLDSPGPVFFRQLRHGYNNRPFWVYKFRSMGMSECNAEYKQAYPNDQRVTRTGRLLRRTNIDELPQLLNVLFGEMSIVGPRPHAIVHNEMFMDSIRPLARRHVVKPGITGWAQANGYRGETDTIEKMRRRVEYDLYYIDNWSFVLDLKIIFMTIFAPEAYQNAY